MTIDAVATETWHSIGYAAYGDLIHEVLDAWKRIHRRFDLFFPAQSREEEGVNVFLLAEYVRGRMGRNPIKFYGREQQIRVVADILVAELQILEEIPVDLNENGLASTLDQDPAVKNFYPGHIKEDAAEYTSVPITSRFVLRKRELQRTMEAEPSEAYGVICGDEVFPGEAYQRAWIYMHHFSGGYENQWSESWYQDFFFVHGLDYSRTERHYWIELGENMIFDGAYQRFYRQDLYCERYHAVAAFTVHEEAQMLHNQWTWPIVLHPNTKSPREAAQEFFLKRRF